MMSNITEELNKIKHAVYGREVRQAIHDAIKQVYDDASFDGDTNMEVILARGVYDVLNDRLNASDKELASKANKNYVDNEFSSIRNQLKSNSVKLGNWTIEHNKNLNSLDFRVT